MISKSESNGSQKTTHTVLEESKVKRDPTSDGVLIKTGTSTLIRLFDEIIIFNSFNLLLWSNI